MPIQAHFKRMKPNLSVSWVSSVLAMRFMALLANGHLEGNERLGERPYEGGMNNESSVSCKYTHFALLFHLFQCRIRSIVANISHDIGAFDWRF